MSQTLRVALAILAVWRLTHLGAREDGPWQVIRRLRQRIAGDAVVCFYCASVWVAAPFAFFVSGGWTERFVAWWAISGGAALLERATAEPTAITIEESDSGVLRPERRAADDQPV